MWDGNWSAGEGGEAPDLVNNEDAGACCGYVKCTKEKGTGNEGATRKQHPEAPDLVDNEDAGVLFVCIKKQGMRKLGEIWGADRSQKCLWVLGRAHNEHVLTLNATQHTTPNTGTDVMALDQMNDLKRQKAHSE